jgi:hypothetical protein
MSQVPSIGRIVHYTLSEHDEALINERREAGDARGNAAERGQVYPLLITRTWGDTPESSVNGQVFLDGDDVLWVTSRSVGEGPGRFAWPVLTR